jgi:hypothetical protein
MADSTAYTEIIETEYDRIVTKQVGKVTTHEASFLLNYRIMELLQEIATNTET